MHNQKENVKVKGKKGEGGGKERRKEQKKKELGFPRIYIRIRLGSWLVVFSAIIV